MSDDFLYRDSQRESDLERIFSLSLDLGQETAWDIILRRDLGKLGFEELRPLMEKAKGKIDYAISNFDEDIASSALRAIHEVYEELVKIIDRIKGLDENDANYSDSRRTLIQEVSMRLTQAIDRLQIHMPYFNAVERSKEIKEPQAVLQPLDDYKEEAKETVDAIKSQLSRASDLFNSLQVKSIESFLKIPFKVTHWYQSQHAWIAIGSLGTAALLVYKSIEVAKELVAGYKISESEILNIIHFMPSILMVVVVLMLLRIAFASYHNFLVRQHRDYVVSQVDTVYNATNSQNARDAILLQSFLTIAVHQGTGFAKTHIDSGVLPLVQRILDTAEPNDK